MDRTEAFEADLAAGARRALEQGREAGQGEEGFEADLVAGVRELLRRREEVRRRREEWVQKRWDEFYQRLAADAVAMDGGLAAGEAQSAPMTKASPSSGQGGGRRFDR